MNCFIQPLLSLIVACLGSSIMFAPNDENTQLTRVDFPADPECWVNSQPICNEAMKGKAIILFFFDSTSQQAADLWPALNLINRDHLNSPIVFVGINSGSKTKLTEYIAEHQVNWPIIHDENRTLEKAYKVPEVNPGHVWHGLILSADNAVAPCRPNDLRPTVNHALQSARWKIDPNEVPESLKAAWLGVEFGQYYQHANVIQRKLKSKKADERRAAGALADLVVEVLENKLASARQLLNNSPWLTYQKYTWIQNQFGDFVAEGLIEKLQRRLRRDRDVRHQLESLALWENAQTGLQSDRKSGVERGRRLLRQLATEFSETDAGRKAVMLLDEVRLADR